MKQQKFSFEHVGMSNNRHQVRANKGFSMIGYTQMDLALPITILKLVLEKTTLSGHRKVIKQINQLLIYRKMVKFKKRIKMKDKNHHHHAIGQEGLTSPLAKHTPKMFKIFCICKVLSINGIEHDFTP